MTGNTKVWRAPLAGLAAVAMLATMGVAASTANAAVTAPLPLPEQPTVTFKYNGGSSPAKGYVGESLVDVYATAFNALPNHTGVTAPSGQKFVGWYAGDKLADWSSAVTGDETVTAKYVNSDNAIPVTFVNVTNGSDVALYNADNNTNTVNVPDGSTLAGYLPVDLADNTIVTSWHVVKTNADSSVAYDKDNLSLADVAKVKAVKGQSITVTATKKLTNTDQATFSTTDPNTLVSGAASDGSITDGVYTVDVAKDYPAKAPATVAKLAGTVPTNLPATFSTWTSGGTTIAKGGDVTSTGTFTPYDAKASVLVEFTGNGQVSYDLVPSGQNLVEKNIPSKDYYQATGWKLAGQSAHAVVSGDGFNGDGYVVDFPALKVTANGQAAIDNFVVFEAEYKSSSDLEVTFHYGDYKGAPEDLVQDLKASDYVTEPEAPTREGYVFKYWYLDDPNVEFNFDKVPAGKVRTDGDSFTLTAKWVRDYQDKAIEALKYVQPDGDWASDLDVNNDVAGYANKDGELKASKDRTHTIPVYAVARSDDQFFTEASFKEFKTAWTAAYKQYQSAVQYAKNGEISKADADKVVSALSDAWKGLRFSTDDADGTLDGVNNGGHAKVIYRLYNPTTGQHLFTGDEVEVKALTNKYTGQGGWTLDKTTFKSVANNNKVVDNSGRWELSGNGFNADWVSNGEGFSPLVNEVKRYAGAREHLYTSDPAEQESLKQGGWSEDSAKASILVPALYTTSTKVVRLYDPAADLHLYSSKKSEVSFWLARGLSQDSDKASFYAL